MKKEIIMRGKTDSGQTERLNFGGIARGYAYRLTDFALYPSGALGSNHYEFAGSVTAGTTAVAPLAPDFDNEGLIGTTLFNNLDTPAAGWSHSIVNDLYLVTQDLILMVQGTEAAVPINWQVKFVLHKMSTSEQAVTNYMQFTVSDAD
jgi:hypothetical protein